jgi:hypothetical protein
MLHRFLSSAIALCAAATVAASGHCAGLNAIAPGCKSSEAPYIRDFYYVGGENFVSAFGNATVDQMYVEKLTPVGGVSQPKPLIFIHGGGPSGATWLNTPDNRYAS